MNYNLIIMVHINNRLEKKQSLNFSMVVKGSIKGHYVVGLQ